jgi:hypothetical protein
MIRKSKRERKRRSLVREDLGGRETVVRRVFSWDSKKTWRRTIIFRTTFQKPLVEFKLIVPSAFAFEWNLYRITRLFGDDGDFADLSLGDVPADYFSETNVGVEPIVARMRAGETLELVFTRRHALVPWWAPWRRLYRHRLTAAILWDEPSGGEHDSARLDTDDGERIEVLDENEGGGGDA